MTIKPASLLLLAAALQMPVLCATDSLQAKSEAILSAALASKNPDTRKQAVAALSLAASSSTHRTRLIAALEDSDVEVRIAAVASLVAIRNKTNAGALRKALNDEVPEVSFAAAKALFALNDPMGKQALLAVLEGENKASSGFLSRQKREALRMIHTPRTALIFAARSGAAFAPIPGLGQGIASMQAIMTDPEVSGRAAAALMLGQQNDPAMVQSFKDALKEKDSSLRVAAIHTLALKNNQAFKKDIAPLLEDDKESVRLRAAAAYIRLSSLRASRPKPAAAP